MKFKIANKTQIRKSKFFNRGYSTLYTRNLKLSKLNNKTKISLLNPYGFNSTNSSYYLNELFVVSGTRFFHKSSVVKIPNFVKNLFANKDSVSVSDSENAGSLLWLRFLNLFSSRIAERYAYNRVNSVRVNRWRNNVAKAQEENNQSNPNVNTNYDNNNNNNIINSNNTNINNNNNNNNNNNDNISNNNNNNISNNNSSSDFDDGGGDLGD